MTRWRNWSGSEQAVPRALLRPRDEDELSAMLKGAPRVRPVGAGHSFAPLCVSDETMMSLEAMPQDIQWARPDAIWVPGGMTLSRLTEALWVRGLSLRNQGDVDTQALAGALATGTHGTGARLPSLAAGALAYRLMLADGSVVICNREENAALFEAQRLSLGLLGVVLEVCLEVEPAYWLEEEIELRPIDEVLEAFDEIAAANRHAEFFFFPYADACILKRLNPVAAPAAPPPPRATPDETVLRLVCELSVAAPPFIPTLQKLISPAGGKRSRVGRARDVYPTERTTPCEEMEYAVPRSVGIATLREALGVVRRADLAMNFPFEFRTVAADDIWLSQFNAGDSATISTHQYGPDWRAIFAAVEPVFSSAGGRPHWGKRHTLDAADIDRLYPQAEAFRSVRRAVDPSGKLLNDYLANYFA